MYNVRTDPPDYRHVRWLPLRLGGLVALVGQVFPDFGAAAAVIDGVEVAGVDILVVFVIGAFTHAESPSYSSGATSAEVC